MIAITVNSQTHTLPAPCTLLELIAQLGHTGKRLAIERNGAIVPRSSHGNTRIQTGDVIEIVIAVGGG